MRDIVEAVDRPHRPRDLFKLFVFFIWENDTYGGGANGAGSTALLVYLQNNEFAKIERERESDERLRGSR